MLLGLASGKVGDLVFYRDGGEQRTRTRVVPKNPRTPAQQRQRCKIANVSAVYRQLSAVLSSAFTSAKPNQSGYNVFAASAIPLAPYLTKEMASAGACLPQPCLMSKGVLPSLPYVGYFRGDQGFGLEVPSSISASTATIGALSAALIANYSQVQQGDKVTYVSLRYTPSSDESLDFDLFDIIPSVTSFVVDTESAETIAAAGFDVLDSTLTTNEMITISEGGVGMGAVILSRVDEGGVLQVSTQRAELSPSASTLYDEYRTAEAANAAIESYMAGSESVLR